MQTGFLDSLLSYSNNIDLTHSLEIGSVIALIALGLGVKHFFPNFRKKSVATTQHTENLSQQVSQDFVNLTVQTAPMNDSKLFFSSGAKKPKLEQNSFSEIEKLQPKVENHIITKSPAIDIEEQMQIIAQQAEESDKHIENQDDKSQFWEEFSHMITDSKKEKPYLPTYTVWANWSSLRNEKTHLSNEVFVLDHQWGTIQAMEELKILINEREVMNSWAMLSVFPLNK